jgi:hypothetical protein
MNQVGDGDGSCVIKTQMGWGVSNLAQSVIFLAMSEIVHMVLLAVADISNVFTFSS